MLLQNQGPIAVTLQRGAVAIQSAHLTGPQTDLQVTGNAPIDGGVMNLAANGNLNLAILEKLDPSVTSSGSVVLAASARGTPTKPILGGQIELHDASFADYSTLPVGIYHANGAIALSGSGAVVRSFTAEAGGGKITLAGSATLGDTLRIGLQARASRVRVPIQQGMSVVASGNINITGTSANSLVSGTVTVDQLSYASQGDLGSILNLAAPPVQGSAPPAAFLVHTRLEVRVRSSIALAVQASLAQNLQIDMDLRVRGTAARPAILGRVNITDGKLVFFGNPYTINRGSIGFYNPVRIQPILDLSLETQTQGVDVTLRVTGPLDNMKLSYTSDPPLPFQEIISLLAAGTTPISDPTILAN
jgi:translocation and assembly module TamB